jgi:hypothetical protein
VILNTLMVEIQLDDSNEFLYALGRGVILNFLKDCWRKRKPRSGFYTPWGVG